MKRFSMGVGRKLLLTNAIAGLLFIAFSVVVFLELSKIEDISSSLVTTNVSRVTENSGVARRLSLAFTESASLMSNFHQKEQLLEEESHRLTLEVDELAASVRSRTLRSSLEDYQRSLVVVFETCRIVNIVLARIESLEDEIIADLTHWQKRLDPPQDLTTSGVDPIRGDTVRTDPGLLERMLLIARQRVDEWPEHFFQPLRPDLDELASEMNGLAVTLRSYTPPPGFGAERYKTLVERYDLY